MSIQADICQILGDVTQNSPFWKKNIPKDICGPEETDKSSNNYQTRSCMAWSMDDGKREAKLDDARRLRRIYFTDSDDQDYRGTLKKCDGKAGKTYAKDLHRCLIAIWYTSSSQCHKQWKYQMQRLQSQEQERRLFWKHNETKKRVHFATLMDMPPQKMRTWNQNCRSTNAESWSVVILQKTTLEPMQFTEQGSSASQVTAAKKIDVVARLPCGDGQATGAVSACTHVKLEDVPRFVNIPETECPDVWIRLPHPIWPKVKHWRSPGTSWTKLEWSPISWIVMWERIRKSFIRNWMGVKNQIGNVWLFKKKKRNRDYSYRCKWTTWKMAGKKQNKAPMWKKLMKNIDLDEPTSFLDHVYLGCTQLECKPNETLIEQYKKMFQSRISAGAKKLPGWENLKQKTVAWSCDMEGHAQKNVERYCELANKKVEQLYKVSSPFLDDLQFIQEELESVGDLSEVCSQIVLKCWNLARIGRPDILWSVSPNGSELVTNAWPV